MTSGTPLLGRRKIGGRSKLPDTTDTRYNATRMREHIPHHLASHEGSSDRSFGLVFTTFFLIVALWPLLHGHDMRLWAMGLAGVFLILALATPKLLAPLNHLWTCFGMLLHRIVSPVALGVLFYGVVTPTGLLMRLFGKGQLHLRLDKSAKSYWIERRPPGPTPESFKLPF